MNDFDILEALELLKQLVALSVNGFNPEDAESLMLFRRFVELTSPKKNNERFLR